MKFKVPVLLIILAVSVSSCKLGRFVIYNFADINDHKKFQNRAIETSEQAWTFEVADTLKPPKSLTVNGEDVAWRDFLKEYKTVAFLLIRNDTVLIEDYLYDYDETSIVPSFSMAKSVVSILIGIAID